MSCEIRDAGCSGRANRIDKSALDVIDSRYAGRPGILSKAGRPEHNQLQNEGIIKIRHIPFSTARTIDSSSTDLQSTSGPDLKTSSPSNPLARFFPFLLPAS